MLVHQHLTILKNIIIKETIILRLEITLIKMPVLELSSIVNSFTLNYVC